METNTSKERKWGVNMGTINHKYEVSSDSLTNDEITYYENVNQGWTCTGEVLKEDFTDKYDLTYHSEYVVMKGFSQDMECAEIAVIIT